MLSSLQPPGTSPPTTFPPQHTPCPLCSSHVAFLHLSSSLLQIFSASFSPPWSVFSPPYCSLPAGQCVLSLSQKTILICYLLWVSRHEATSASLFLRVKSELWKTVVSGAPAPRLTSFYCWRGLLQHTAAVTTARSLFQVDEGGEGKTHGYVVTF